MPLRASSFRRDELRTIIFVTDLQYMTNEWSMLSTFPDIYILNVRPMRATRCDSFQILGFADQSVQSEIGLDSGLLSVCDHVDVGSRKLGYVPRR